MIEKVRAQKISIDLPVEGAEAWVSIILQKVIKDDNYKTIQTIDRFGYIHKQVPEILSQAIQLPNTTGFITGEDMATIIRGFVRDWILEQYPNFSLNEHGDLTRVI